jgi:hypothetical protein
MAGKPATGRYRRSIPEQAQPWQPQSALSAHLLSIVYIVSAIACAIAAFVVLRSAAGSPITAWTLSPTVYLSILATWASLSLRAAFRRGADTAWWSHLLREDGVPLQDLHRSWKISHGVSMPFIPSGSFVLLRMAATAGLLLGLSGPLLQRAAVVVEQVRVYETNATLPVRIRPNWNLTVMDAGSVFVIDTPPYQPEFGQIVLDQYNHVPAQLPAGSCPTDATCTATVTVAGFQRSCNFSEKPWQAIDPFIGPICTRDMQNAGVYSNCSIMPPAHLQTLIQLAIGPNTTSDPYNSSVGLLGDLMDGSHLTYLAYLRTDSSSDMLTVQDCTFTASFVQLPVSITNGTNIALDTQQPVAETPSSRNVIYMPHTGVLTGGWIQAMGDFFGGYNVWDSSRASQYISGIMARAYLNQSSLNYNITSSFSNESYLDPLPDFTATLNELSLRYALAAFPTDPVRLHDWEGFIGEDMAAGNWTQELAYPISATQDVAMQTSQKVASYDVDYAYLIVAIAIMLGTALLMTSLVAQGWTALGRCVSTSPLEIAKAFDAPLLQAAGSNVSGGDIGRMLGDVQVRYGEVRDSAPEGDELSGKSESVVAYRKEWAVRIRRDLVDESATRNTRQRLGIAVASSVVAPRPGIMYQ